MNRLILLAFVIFLLTGFPGFAQTASATWSLTTDGTPALVGSISAGSVIPSTSTNITGFAGYSFGSTSPAGLKLGATGATSWPADGSSTTANAAFTGITTANPRYVQFTLSPSAGNSLTINSITVPLTENGSATNINAALGYSTDGINFTTFNSNGVSGNALPANTLQTFSASPSLSVSSGAVIVRIILWRKAGSTASSSSVTIGTVVVSGTTSAIATPVLSVSTIGPLVFDATSVGSSSASQSFTVGGANLTNNIIITPPAGFEIRTGTNSFSSSPVTLTQSGGSVSSVAVDVRFTPLTAGGYSGNVTCASTGASEQDVAVIGPGSYYSKSTGTLDALSSWTTDPNGGTGSAPANFTTPGQIYYIRNNSEPTLGANWIVSGANAKVIIGDGSNVCVFTVPTGFTYSASATEIANQSTLVLQNAASLTSLGSLTVDNGGTYQHACEGGAQLSGTFMTGSTINVTGVVASNLWLPQSCYNIVWNCPSQTAGGKCYNTDGTLTINGNLTVLSTGTGYCAVNTGSGTRTLNIAGNLDVQGGSFRLQGASTGSGVSTANVAGNVTVSGNGVINLTSTTNASPALASLNVQGNFLHTAGTVTKTSATGTARITFNGSTQQEFSTTGISTAVDVVVNNTSGIKMLSGNSTSSTVSGNLTVTSGTLDLNGNVFSFAGSTLTNNGTIKGVAANSILRFNGSTPQTYTGTGTVDSPLNEIRFSNSSAGVTLSPSVNPIVALAARFYGSGGLTNSNNLILGDGSSLVTVGYGLAGGTSPVGNFDQKPTYNLGSGKINILYSGDSTARTTGVELPASRTVSYLLCNNPNGLSVSGGPIIISDSLGLRSGSIGNGLDNQLVLGDGAKITREAGSLALAPVFGTTVNVAYLNPMALVTGAELPSDSGTLHDLFIDNTGDTNSVQLGVSATVNGTLNLVNGSISLGSHNLILNTSASISGTPSAGTMILAEGSGKLIKRIANAQSLPYTFVFPVGSITDSAKYTPVSFTVGSGVLSDGSQIGVNTISSKYVNNTNSTDYLKYYWTVTDSGITSPSYSAIFSYALGDVIGAESNLYTALYNSRWSVLSVVNSSVHQMNATGLASLGVFTAGAQSGFQGSATTAISIKLLPQGYAADPANNQEFPLQSFLIHIANASAPFADIESHAVTIDPATLTGTASFSGLTTGIYYIYVTHLNTIETWSREGGELITAGTTFSYDFTSAKTQAYGGNLIQAASGKWCIFSGDCDGSGFIDNNDLLQIDNDAFNFKSGSGFLSDLDGSRYVDNNDLLICDNNAYRFVGAAKPRATKRMQTSGSQKSAAVPEDAK